MLIVGGKVSYLSVDFRPTSKVGISSWAGGLWLDVKGERLQPRPLPFFPHGFRVSALAGEVIEREFGDWTNWASVCNHNSRFVFLSTGLPASPLHHWEQPARVGKWYLPLFDFIVPLSYDGDRWGFPRSPYSFVLLILVFPLRALIRCNN
jgi:hypothetical protein